MNMLTKGEVPSNMKTFVKQLLGTTDLSKRFAKEKERQQKHGRLD